MPKYKALARDIVPGRATERLERHRYAPLSTAQHDDPRIPCQPIDAETLAAHGMPVKGSRCYAPTEHSARRKTCQFLVPPDAGWPMHFPPGLHLYGHGHLNGAPPLKCTAHDFIDFDTTEIDTDAGAVEPYSIVVLGPFVHPVTRRLVVKCLPLSAMANADSLASFGMLFSTPDASERGVMVPSLRMVRAFGDAIDDAIERTINPLLSAQLSEVDALIDYVRHTLYVQKTAKERLQRVCEDDPALRATVRVILRSFYEAALYYRRWAGPGRKVPLTLLPAVGAASNPLSPALRGRFVTPTARGARVGATGHEHADFVADPEGTLTSMSQAHTRAALLAFETLTATEKGWVRGAFQLGTPFRMIDGSGYYLSTEDPNVSNGNPRHMKIDLFDMCFGTDDDRSGFRAVSSVDGTRTYCVQIAAIQMVRTVQTLLPFVYKTSPTWATVDGEFDNVHT
jgi:hypothetical protein